MTARNPRDVEKTAQRLRLREDAERVLGLLHLQRRGIVVVGGELAGLAEGEVRGRAALLDVGVVAEAGHGLRAGEARGDEERIIAVVDVNVLVALDDAVQLVALLRFGLDQPAVARDDVAPVMAPSKSAAAAAGRRGRGLRLTG